MDIGAVNTVFAQIGAVALLAASLCKRARTRTEEHARRGGRDRSASLDEARFLATLSHEMRTPLAGILGMADLLRLAGLSPEHTCYVEAIRRSGAALIALIDETLDRSRIEAGRLALVADAVDLARLVEDVVELLAPCAQGKGLEIAASIGADAPKVVRADAMRLRQVLLNLAGNAVKFTERGGVCVAVERGEGDALRLAVIDTGPGVPPDRREAIFEDYQQGDGSSGRRLEGAGLGLPISRRLVALMGGTLSLSDTPGGGSTFAFTISAPACEGAAPDPNPGLPPGARAVIVANSPFEAPAIALRLAEIGVTVARAEGLASGLAALAGRDRPDVVIVDCALGPEATGRLAEAAREAGALKTLALFSPFERRAFGQRSLDGFDGWLVKPVRARSLYERLAAEVPAAPQRARRAAPDDPPPRRALVAEDADINALIAEKALRRLGFEPVRARDGVEAVRLASPRGQGAPPPFDLILMDLRMPRIDGFEAARRLRRWERQAGARPTPIVALSADRFARDLGRAQEHFDALLTKPFDVEDLANAVDRLCRQGRTAAGGLSKAS
ncbi:response regulator receiver domain-containing protein [Roseiarcus fermentans]|uniref:histidine kinase n=1 Tax=Roseiarcus fermentans TaxID=1473586 RepID=A0A366FVK5_9HYPH|nr:ATP-binding protein [Roseiarcus fermentans]RBP17729.1 response regulator receiver domain-containing protein [Roseiarcus fermentans]